MFEKFGIDDRNIFKVCIVATMSSGKSTFMNAIIGETIMPEKNQACTARTMAVLDNDNADFKKVHVVRNDGSKEVFTIENQEVLDWINNDQTVSDFLVETDIKSIKNTSRAVTLVDTPGVNNSKDHMHGTRTKNFISQLDHGMLIYLLNATQLSTHDDSELLNFISDHIKRMSGNVKIIFVVNKIDLLDKDKEDIVEILKEVKSYIEDHGIENPSIYPLSAQSAKLLKLVYYKKHMTKREELLLGWIYKDYSPKGNNMLSYAMLEDDTDEIYEIGGNKVTGRDLKRAIDNTGITAIEKKIESYMLDMEQSFNPNIVIKPTMSQQAAETFQIQFEKIQKQIVLENSEKFEKIKKFVKEYAQYNSFNQKKTEAFKDGYWDMCVQNVSVIKDEETFIDDMQQMKDSLVEVFASDKIRETEEESCVYIFPEIDKNSFVAMKHFFKLSIDKKRWIKIQYTILMESLENNGKSFIKSCFTNKVYEINNENKAVMIALLDTKISVAFIEIKDFDQKVASFTEVESYISGLKNDKLEKERLIKDTEDQLRRTYKGVVFESEDKKKDIIKEEKEIAKYCQEISNKKYNEVLEVRNKVALLPQAIFAEYITKMIIAMDKIEKRDIESIAEEIEKSNLKELKNLKKRMSEYNYSDEGMNRLWNSIAKQEEKCKIDILDRMVENIEELSRDQIKTLISEIKSLEFEEQLTGSYIFKLNKEYDDTECNELKSICNDLDKKNIEELEELLKNLSEGNFQSEFVQPYIVKINIRINYLHVKKMEQLCANLDHVNYSELESIQENIKDENCDEELKDQFYKEILHTKEKLEYEELCKLTVGLENKELEELEEILKEIMQRDFPKKYVGKFLNEIRVMMEVKKLEYLKKQLGIINEMSKVEVESLRKKIEKFEYPRRITENAYKVIENKIFSLDMLEMIDFENDFNSLSLKNINDIRLLLEQKNLSLRSQEMYSKKLYERATAISYENVSRYVFYFNSLCQINEFSADNLLVAGGNQNYEAQLQVIRQHVNKSMEGEYPIFIYPDLSMLTFSTKNVYFNKSSQFMYVSTSKIRRFVIEKKYFLESFGIELTDGTRIILSGNLNKKMLRKFVNIINEFMSRMDEEIYKFSPMKFNVSNFDRSFYEKTVCNIKLSQQSITSIFLDEYQQLEKQFGKSVDEKTVLNDNWMKIRNKMNMNFGLDDSEFIIWFYDGTLFHSAKEGVALGIDRIHIKESGGEIRRILFEEIYEISVVDRVMHIVTTDNNTYLYNIVSVSTERIMKLVNILFDYVKGMQLVCQIKRLKESEKN